DENGMLKDLNNISVPVEEKGKADSTADVKNFFSLPYSRPVDGRTQSVRDCTICKKRSTGGFTMADYLAWAAQHNFISMLPNDAKAQKDLKDAALKSQSTLNGHVHAQDPSERVIPYSNEAFKSAAIQWLVETDQHPAFHTMINLASRAKNGIKIPHWKATQCEILRLFSQYLIDLKQHLNVTSNVDGYFAVTAHWIEEKSPNEWSLKGALIGPNITMMGELAKHIHTNHRVEYDGGSQRIGCLAHIVNLATQAVIATQSKSPHYNPHKPDDHMPDTSADTRDKVGLVRAISVKVCWSSTYMMLNRAYSLRLHIKQFLLEISRVEKNVAKAAKLLSLRPSEDEWKCVKVFQQILAVFYDAIQAGLDKIAEYYDKTGDNDAYVFSILLEPSKCMYHFDKHWSDTLCNEVLKLSKNIVSSNKRRYSAALAALSTDNNDDGPIPPITTARTCGPTEALEPWEKEYQKYLELDEDIPEGMSTVKCERAFSSAGITITKHRNRLKGDIVEALQALKCAYRRDLFFHDIGPSALTEEDAERDEEIPEGVEGSVNEKDTVVSIELELDSDAEEEG
ncbi:hypothetical protein JAAARDRAFT_135739, partial [Jaapia argillacea MUCL 33604]